MKDVIILAWGNSRWRCPFDAEEIWGINNIWLFPEFKDKRFDKVFAFDMFPDHCIEKMKALAPLVSWRDYADIKYPLEEIQKEFNSSYFTNSITYMIAYAAYLKVPEVRLYGVDAPYGSKYMIDKSGVEYWIAKAEDRGTKVIPSEGSHLLRTITGEPYGGDTQGWVQLYFMERMHILNLLPMEGHYEEMNHVSVVRQVLSPRKDEHEEFGIEMQHDMNGMMSFTCKQEFARAIFLPQDVWDFIANHLKEREESGKLPVTAMGLYEKLVLAPKRHEDNGEWKEGI